MRLVAARSGEVAKGVVIVGDAKVDLELLRDFRSLTLLYTYKGVLAGWSYVLSLRKGYKAKTKGRLEEGCRVPDGGRFKAACCVML